MVIAIVIVALIILLAIVYISIRNGMIGSRNRVDEAWSGIDVQLKRRHDLVPNLVETVKGYAEHEQGVFTKVTQARAEAMSSRGVGDTSKAEGQLSAALTDLRAVAENYPTLRATENFQQLTGSSLRSRTRSRPRAGFTTRTSRPTTRRSRSSRTR